MKRDPKKKGKKKSRKKGGIGKVFVFLIIVGMGLILAYHYRQEIMDFLRPLSAKKPEKKIAVKEKKVVTLFFSEEEGEYLVGEKREIPTLYSILNSLSLNFPQIKRVQILIDGKAVESIAGHISLKQPVSFNPSIVKKMAKKRGLH